MVRKRSLSRSAALIGMALILLVGFGLRLVNLGGRTLWYDESFAVLFARTGLSQMLYGTLTPVAGGAADIHPLLYYTVLNGWMRIFGQSPEMVRLFSVLIGVLTIAVVYRLAADVFDWRVGLTAALITALAPFHIQYSQETRMYALLALLLLLATWCYWRAWQGRGRLWWIGFGLLAALAMYTQQLAAFYLAALGLTGLIARRDRRWDLVLPTAGSALLALVLYLPWLVNLPDQLSKLQSYYWVARPSIVRPLLTLRSFTVVALDIPADWNIPTFFVGLVLTVFLVLQMVMRRRRMPRQEVIGLRWVLWLAFGSVALLWLASQVLTPVYLDRGLLAQGIVFYIALAWLFTRGGLPRLITAVLVAVWIVVAAAGFYFQVTWHTFPNSPFDAAVTYLAESAAPSDTVIHSNKLTALPMVYYGPDLPQTYMADRPGSPEDTLALPTQEVLNLLGAPCMAEAAGGADRVWFVIFTQEEAQYIALPDYDAHPHLAWLRTHYTEGETVAFEDLLVIVFSGPDGYAPVCDQESGA
jgi:mannosyltransferase